MTVLKPHINSGAGYWRHGKATISSHWRYQIHPHSTWQSSDILNSVRTLPRRLWHLQCARNELWTAVQKYVNVNIRNKDCARKSKDWIILIQEEANDRISLCTFVFQAFFFNSRFVRGRSCTRKCVSVTHVHVFRKRGSPFCELMYTKQLAILCHKLKRIYILIRLHMLRDQPVCNVHLQLS
jgi:hypothetical protein